MHTQHRVTPKNLCQICLLFVVDGRGWTSLSPLQVNYTEPEKWMRLSPLPEEEEKRCHHVGWCDRLWRIEGKSVTFYVFKKEAEQHNLSKKPQKVKHHSVSNYEIFPLKTSLYLSCISFLWNWKTWTKKSLSCRVLRLLCRSFLSRPSCKMMTTIFTITVIIMIIFALSLLLSCCEAHIDKRVHIRLLGWYFWLLCFSEGEKDTEKEDEGGGRNKLREQKTYREKTTHRVNAISVVERFSSNKSEKRKDRELLNYCSDWKTSWGKACSWGGGS